jgi:hypothetical protein
LDSGIGIGLGPGMGLGIVRSRGQVYRLEKL